MILALNIGNSNITFGGYTPDGKLVFSSRLFADTALSSDELLYKIVNMLALYGAEPQQITAVIFSSVVPALTPRLREALRKMCECQIMEVGPGLKSGVRIRMDNPAQLGGELLRCWPRLPVRSVPGRQPNAPLAFCRRCSRVSSFCGRPRRLMYSGVSTGTPSTAPNRRASSSGRPGIPGSGWRGGTGTMQLYSGSAVTPAYCGIFPGCLAGSAPNTSTATRSASSRAYQKQPPRLQRKTAVRTISS